MLHPDQQTREYPAGTGIFSIDEKRRIGVIRPKYDRPNTDGYTFYGAGLVRLVPELSVGLMVHPHVTTEEPIHSIDLDVISSGLDYANWQGTKEQILEILRQQSTVHLPESINPNYALIVMRAQRIGRERSVLMAWNVPFRYYHQSSRERITESEFSLAHEVRLEKGDGLLVASPQVIEGVYDDKKFQIMYTLKAKDLDPAVHLLSSAHNRLELQAKRGERPYAIDPTKQAVMVVRASSIPSGGISRFLPGFLRG